MNTFPTASVGGESSPVAVGPAAVPSIPERLGTAAAGEAIYAELCRDLDAAFAAMEVTWVRWREGRPDEAALQDYLADLSRCNAIHQLLKKFPQYEPFRKDFPTSPSSDGVGMRPSHGIHRDGGVGGEGMVERAARGGGGAGRCPGRSPLLGAAVPRGVAAGASGTRRGVLRVRRERPPLSEAQRVLWVALATLCGVPVVGMLIHWISKL